MQSRSETLFFLTSAHINKLKPISILPHNQNATLKCTYNLDSFLYGPYFIQEIMLPRFFCRGLTVQVQVGGGISTWGVIKSTHWTTYESWKRYYLNKDCYNCCALNNNVYICILYVCMFYKIEGGRPKGDPLNFISHL